MVKRSVGPEVPAWNASAKSIATALVVPELGRPRGVGVEAEGDLVPEAAVVNEAMPERGRGAVGEAVVEKVRVKKVTVDDAAGARPGAGR